MAHIWGNNRNWQTLFWWASKSLQMVPAAMKLKDAWSLEEKYDRPIKQHIKKQRHYFANKGPSCQSYGFSSSHIWMWELDHKESWALKNWCFSTVVLKNTFESPLNYQEIQPVHPKGNHSWIFIGRTDAETETPTLWPPDMKNWLIGKDPDAGKDWSQEEKGDDRAWDGWMASLTGWTWVWVSSGSWWWTGKLGCAAVHAVSKSWTWLSDWTELSHHLQWFWSLENKVCHCFHCFPIYLPWSDGTECHDLSFLIVGF